MSNFNEYYEYREDVELGIELTNFAQEILLEVKKKHPAAGVSKKKRSEIVKKARTGENVFGGGFDKVAGKAEKEYGSKEAGKRVAAAIMWKKAKGRKKMTNEEVDDLLWILEDDLKIILDWLERKKVNESVWDQIGQTKRFFNVKKYLPKYKHLSTEPSALEKPGDLQGAVAREQGKATPKMGIPFSKPISNQPAKGIPVGPRQANTNDKAFLKQVNDLLNMRLDGTLPMELRKQAVMDRLNNLGIIIQVNPRNPSAFILVRK